MRWMGLGITLRALLMPMGYITFAKNNKKVFFALEGVFGNLLTLILSCLGFYFFGLIGLGYAFVADNAICLIVYYVVNRHLYGYGFTKTARFAISCAIILASGCFVASFIDDAVWSYSLMGIALLITLVWGIVNLRRKLKKTDE